MTVYVRLSIKAPYGGISVLLVPLASESVFRHPVVLGETMMSGCSASFSWFPRTCGWCRRHEAPRLQICPHLCHIQSSINRICTRIRQQQTKGTSKRSHAEQVPVHKQFLQCRRPRRHSLAPSVAKSLVFPLTLCPAGWCDIMQEIRAERSQLEAQFAV